jgi:hypothetical protein
VGFGVTPLTASMAGLQERALAFLLTVAPGAAVSLSRAVTARLRGKPEDPRSDNAREVG